MKHKPDINRGERTFAFVWSHDEICHGFIKKRTGSLFISRPEMSSKPYVVMGEAKESESEEEIDSSAASGDLLDHCKGKIVIGEAPESDEECCATAGSMDSLSSAVSALSAPTVSGKRKASKKHQSILVQKLYEKNSIFYKNLTEFIEQIATNAGNELNAANKRLLKCQLQMQEGADYLRMLNSNLTALDSNLQMLLSTKYLPDIRVDKAVVQELKSKPP